MEFAWEVEISQASLKKVCFCRIFFDFRDGRHRFEASNVAIYLHRVMHPNSAAACSRQSHSVPTPKPSGPRKIPARPSALFCVTAPAFRAGIVTVRASAKLPLASAEVFRAGTHALIATTERFRAGTRSLRATAWRLRASNPVFRATNPALRASSQIFRASAKTLRAGINSLGASAKSLCVTAASLRALAKCFCRLTKGLRQQKWDRVGWIKEGCGSQTNSSASGSNLGDEDGSAEVVEEGHQTQCGLHILGIRKCIASAGVVVRSLEDFLAERKAWQSSEVLLGCLEDRGRPNLLRGPSGFPETPPRR